MVESQWEVERYLTRSPLVYSGQDLVSSPDWLTSSLPSHQGPASQVFRGIILDRRTLHIHQAIMV